MGMDFTDQDWKLVWILGADLEMSIVKLCILVPSLGNVYREQ